MSKWCLPYTGNHINISSILIFKGCISYRTWTIHKLCSGIIDLFFLVKYVENKHQILLNLCGTSGAHSLWSYNLSVSEQELTIYLWLVLIH